MKQSTRFFIYLLISLSLITSAAWAQKPTPAPSPSKPPSQNGESTKLEEQTVKALKSGSIMLNFDNVDIKAISKVMSELTGRTIILEKTVTGTLTIISPRKVGIKEAWELYVSALEAAGFGVVLSGKVAKVLPLADARKEDTRYVGVMKPKLRKGYVVALVLMGHADAELMANTLRPMMTASGIIAAYRPSNAVIITDTAKNTGRLVEIVRQLDANYRGNSLHVYQPKYVNVTELSKALQPLFTAAGANAEQQVKVSPYEPTNTLLITAPEAEYLQIESVLAELDNEERVIKPDEKKFRVHYLQNAIAEDVAKIISAMMEEKKKVVEEVKKETEVTQQATEKQKGAFISTKVSADPATNSLVLYVTDKEYEELKKMIAYLDAERKEVLISAIVAEVDLKRVVEIGTRFQIVTDKGLVSFQGGLSLDQIYNTLASGNFIIGGVSTQGVNVTTSGQTTFFPNLFTILQLLETDNNFNVLSAPRILTEDHKEASINVGQIVPFATGVKFDATGQPVITYDYKDVGLTLKVTPHISQTDNVRMELDQIVKDVTDYLKPSVGAVGYVVPIVSNRELKTWITIRNNQTIIIGGLIQNRTLDVMKKVPFFQSLPLIGQLFRDSSRERDKTTLFVFITPHIIDSPRDLEEVTNKYGRVLHEDKSINEKAPFILDEDKEETY